LKEYDNYSDEELIVRIKDGESEIADYIIQKYKNLVRKITKSMHILGGDKDDLIQEGMIGLYKAIRDYDSGRDASFMTFAEICVQRQLFTAIQASNRKKHTPLNEYVSIYSDGGENDDGDSEAMLVNVLCNVTDQTPEQALINRELLDEIDRFMDEELSPIERQVIKLSMTGMTSAEAARVLGRDAKSTDNALSRAKSKLKKVLRS